MAGLDFVDSIAATPTVRLALSDGVTWNVGDGTEFPPPPLRHAIAQTLLTDGAVIPSSAYDLRRITLDLILGTGDDTADEIATAMQALYRQLDRPGGNILRLNDHTTNPIFFRTFRASAGSVTHRMPSDGTKKRIGVDLLAEPFGYGLKETPVELVTVSTDPAAVSNPCLVDVTGVKGDVEAPAYIRFPSAATVVDDETVLAVRRRGTPSGVPFPFQAEAVTQGLNTTTQANDANFSGAGNNYSRCTFGTATMQTRLQITDLGTSSADLRGRYRVFLRYRKNTSGDAINLQLRTADATLTTIIDQDVYATPNTTNITTAELGEIAIPIGADPVFDPSGGAELNVSEQFAIFLRAERTSGSGSIDFDFLLLVPADDRLAILKWQIALPSGYWLLDSRDNSVHARDSSDRVIGAGPPTLVGGLPMLSPGQTNRLYMLRNVTAGTSYTLTTVPNVSVSYLPRYLSVRPAAT